MIENVFSTIKIPLGLGFNFKINNKEYIVPMAVEEPFVITALCNASKIIG